MKKPTTQLILNTPTLTSLREPNPSRCTVCGEASESGLDVMRECNANDHSIPGPTALVFIGRGDPHKPCRKAVEDHPRLYEDAMAHPGHMPLLCGPCVHRSVLTCASPQARSNGGPGIEIKMRRPAPFQGVVCIRGPKGKNLAPPREGVACSGRET